MDRAGINELQRIRRRRNGNAYTHKYERTNPKGFLMRVYRNMKSRVEGVQTREAHYYVGLPLLPRDEFYAWAQADSRFWELWHDWQAYGRSRGYTPSIDRIDVEKGYEIGNMRWVTHSRNSGQLTRRNTTTRARGDAWHAARKHEGCSR